MRKVERERIRERRWGKERERMRKTYSEGEGERAVNFKAELMR